MQLSYRLILYKNMVAMKSNPVASDGEVVSLLIQASTFDVFFEGFAAVFLPICAPCL